MNLERIRKSHHNEYTNTEESEELLSEFFIFTNLLLVIYEQKLLYIYIYIYICVNKKITTYASPYVK